MTEYRLSDSQRDRLLKSLRNIDGLLSNYQEKLATHHIVLPDTVMMPINTAVRDLRTKVSDVINKTTGDNIATLVRTANKFIETSRNNLREMHPDILTTFKAALDKGGDEKLNDQLRHALRNMRGIESHAEVIMGLCESIKKQPRETAQLSAR